MHDVFELEMPTLSQMIRAETAIGQEQGVKGVLARRWRPGSAGEASGLPFGQTPLIPRALAPPGRS